MPEPAGPPTFTPVLIVVYLALHALWRQFVFGDYAFVVLRGLFLAVVAGIALSRGARLRRASFAPWRSGLTGRDAAYVAGLFIAIVAARVTVEWLRPFPALAPTGRAILDNCAIAPVNEELLFRALFLGILLRSMPGRRGAVWVSALVFASCHDVASGSPSLVDVLTLGLLLGSVYATTRSLALCIVGHVIWNAVSFVPLPFRPG